MLAKKRFLITAANTDHGKTHFSLDLLSALADLGYKVGAMKPIETGVNEKPLDASRLYERCRVLNDGFKHLSLKQVCPITFNLPAAPMIAKKDQNIDYGLLHKSLNEIEQYADIVLIETAGGIMSPIDEKYSCLDLANIFNAKVLFLVANKLGMMSETWVNFAYFKQQNISFDWIINDFGQPQYFNKINKAFFDMHFKDYFMFPNDIEEFVQKITKI